MNKITLLSNVGHAPDGKSYVSRFCAPTPLQDEDSRSGLIRKSARSSERKLDLQSSANMSIQQPSHQTGAPPLDS